MNSQEKKVTIEWVNSDRKNSQVNMSNPIKDNYTQNTNISKMVTKILDDEFPHLKNNSLLHDLVLYTLVEKVNTVQKVENVLSYIKENNVKKVQDVCFKNGEVRIKCSI